MRRARALARCSARCAVLAALRAHARALCSGADRRCRLPRAHHPQRGARAPPPPPPAPFSMLCAGVSVLALRRACLPSALRAAPCWPHAHAHDPWSQAPTVGADFGGA
eukprot:2716729-Prymnesium_polylepis.1